MNKMMCTLAEEVMDVVVNMEESSKRVKRRRVPKTESGSGVGEFMAGCYWIGHGKHQSLFNHIVETQVPSHGKPKGGLAADLVYAIMKLQHEYFNNGFWNAMDEFDAYIGIEDVASSEFSWGYPQMLGFLFHHGGKTARDIVDHCREKMSDDDDEESDESDYDARSDDQTSSHDTESDDDA